MCGAPPTDSSCSMLVSPIDAALPKGDALPHPLLFLLQRGGATHALGQFLHVGEPYPIPPPMHQFAGIRRSRKEFECFDLRRAGPLVALHLQKDEIRTPNSHNVKHTPRSGCAYALVAQ